MCTASKADTKRMIKEDSTLLRNIVNYKEDLLKDDVSRTGIKQR